MGTKNNNNTVISLIIKLSFVMDLIIIVLIDKCVTGRLIVAISNNDMFSFVIIRIVKYVYLRIKLKVYFVN